MAQLVDFLNDAGHFKKLHPKNVIAVHCKALHMFQNQKAHKGIVHKGFFHNNGNSKYSHNALKPKRNNQTMKKWKRPFLRKNPLL
eukprot:3779312-Amphidinium_carterae.1